MQQLVDKLISIHAPREGGDPVPGTINAPYGYFNPRPPRGGRPPDVIRAYPSLYISIHAPREGGDFNNFRHLHRVSNFNPRPPRGGRQLPLTCDLLKSGFQSTPPARGATVDKILSDLRKIISIHAPREGGDSCLAAARSVSLHFNPRPPRGGRRLRLCRWIMTFAFQSTPPARGATQ